MSRDDLTLSRRQLLSALGVTGASAATAGVGTSALFGDEESFEGNRVVAGSLDARVAWTEHRIGSGSGTDAADVRWEDGVAADGRVGLPTETEAVVSVPDAAAAERLLAETLADSYPAGYDAGDVDTPCAPDGPLGDAEGSPPAVDVADVVPGDAGVVSLDVALCDNPGYVWLRGRLRSAAEGGVTEPEGEAAVEDGDPDATDPERVELLDAARAAVWVDDGDGLQDDGESPALVGSLRHVLETLSSGDGLPLDGDGDDAGDGVACFTAGALHSAVLAWWLPRDAGNAVQSDAVRFDVGLYAEQCRGTDAPAAGGGVLPESTLTAPGGDGADFGRALAVDGGTLAVGTADGSVTVFEAGDDGWRATTTLTADADDDFGASVALRGDALLVGAPDGDAAHLYRRDDGWSRTATLEPATTPTSFGRESVALGDGVAAVSGFDGAYVYADPGSATGSTTETARLLAGTDRPAVGLAADGTTLAVGTPAVGTLAAGGPGRVAVVDGSEGWSASERTVTATLSTGRFDNVGSSLALDGDTLLVGASYRADTGAVLAYERGEGGDWSRVARVAPADGAVDGRFGASVAVDDDGALVGAPAADAAYALERDGEGWPSVPDRRLLAAAVEADVDFGDAVALGRSALVGAPETASDTGAVYGFGR